MCVCVCFFYVDDILFRFPHQQCIFQFFYFTFFFCLSYFPCQQTMSLESFVYTVQSNGCYCCAKGYSVFLYTVRFINIYNKEIINQLWLKPKPEEWVPFKTTWHNVLIVHRLCSTHRVWIEYTRMLCISSCWILSYIFDLKYLWVDVEVNAEMNLKYSCAEYGFSNKFV